jgi:hypothetical protein
MLGHINTIDKKFFQKIFFTEENLPKPFLTQRNWWKFFLTIILLIVGGPIFKSNGKIISHESIDVFIDQIKIVSVLFGFILIPIVWIIQIRPLLIRRLGYYYIGNFEIKKKINVFDLLFIIQLQERSSWLFVSRHFFDSTKVGDFLEVKQSCLGGLDGIQKVKMSHQRIKKLIKRL